MLLRLTEFVVAQSEIQSTGNPKIDLLVAAAVGAGGLLSGLGAVFGVKKWRGGKQEPEPESDHGRQIGDLEKLSATHAEKITQLAERLAAAHAEMLALAERQTAAAETTAAIAKLVDRIDQDLRDARERVAAVEGRQGT